MVSSPFPGMDPFLEINPRWEVFHGWFIRELARQSMGRARELGCEVEVERSVYGREPTGELVLLGEPDQLERYKQQYIVVRQAGDWPRALAVVELLSFANKQGNYAPKYREKRSRFLSSMTHFMEIDFLRAGENPSRTLFPELPLDLAAAFQSAYHLSHRPSLQRSYQEGRVPDPPLGATDQAWLAQILESHNRSQPPTDGNA